MQSITSSPVAMQNAAAASAVPFFRSPTSGTHASTPFASALSRFKYSNPKTRSAVSSAPGSFDSVNPPLAQKPLQEGNLSLTGQAANQAAILPIQIVAPALVQTPAGVTAALSSSLLDATPGHSPAVATNTVASLLTSQAAGPLLPAAATTDAQQLPSDAAQNSGHKYAPDDTPSKPQPPVLPPDAAIAAQPQVVPLISPSITPEDAHAQLAPNLTVAQTADPTAGPPPARASTSDSSQDKGAPACEEQPVQEAGDNLPQPTALSVMPNPNPAPQQSDLRRPKNALEIISRLHSPFGNPPAASSAQPGTVVADLSLRPASDKLASPGSNGSISSSVSSSSVKPVDSGNGSLGTGHSGRGDSDSQNVNPRSVSNAANAANAAGAIVNGHPDTSRHVTGQSVAPLAPPTDAGPNANKLRPASGDMLPARQSLPSPGLPSSLSDLVQASRLYQRLAGAEMHVSMDTDLLGSIDLRAVVHQSGLTATIGVQHADVQALLTGELPGLHHALSQKDLHVEQISILGSAVGSQSNHGGNQQHNDNPAFAPQAPAAWSRNAIAGEKSKPSAGDSAVAGSGAGRLSVHA